MIGRACACECADRAGQFSGLHYCCLDSTVPCQWFPGCPLPVICLQITLLWQLDLACVLVYTAECALKLVAIGAVSALARVVTDALIA